MSNIEVREWNRKEFKPGDVVSVKPSEIKEIRQRFWNLADESKIEGAVIELNDGGEIGIACDAATARRALGVIETPEGLTNPPKVFAPAKGTKA